MFNPREDQDNLGVLCTWHRRYDFNDPGVRTGGEYGELWLEVNGGERLYGSAAALEAALSKHGVLLPVYLYDHSCQILDTKSFLGRAPHAEWDSGRVGFIFAPDVKIREWYGVKRISKVVRAKAVQLLRAEVEEYSNYLNGW